MALTSAEKQRRYRERQARAAAAHPAPAPRPPAAKAPARRRQRPPSFPPAPSGLGSTADECAELAVRLKRQVIAADEDPECPWPVRASLKQSMARVLAQLARHRGESEITESTVARSAPFRRLIGLIVESLKPYPDALRAAAAVVEAAVQGER